MGRRKEEDLDSGHRGGEYEEPGVGALGCPRQRHAGIPVGSLAAHRTMTVEVCSLEGEGGTEFSPSSLFSDPSSFRGWELWPHKFRRFTPKEAKDTMTFKTQTARNRARIAVNNFLSICM